VTAGNIAIALIAAILSFPASADNGVCLTPRGGVQPEFTADGKQLVYVLENNDGEKRLLLKSLENTGAEPRDTGIAGTDPRRLNDPEKMVFFSDALAPEIKLWDLKTGKIEACCPGVIPEGPVGTLTSGAIVFPIKQSQGLELQVYDIRQGLRLPEKFPLNACAVSRDGKMTAVMENDKGVNIFKIVETSSGKTIFRTQTPPVAGGMQIGGCHSPAFSPDGRYVVYVQAGIQPIADLILVELATGKSTRLTNDAADNQSPVFSPDGKRIAYSSARNGKYRVWMLHLER